MKARHPKPKPVHHARHGAAHVAPAKVKVKAKVAAPQARWAPGPSRPTSVNSNAAIPVPARPAPSTASEALAAVSTMPVWPLRSPPQQSQLNTLATGSSPLAARATWALGLKLTSPEFVAAEPAEQARLLKAALSETPLLPGVVSTDTASQVKTPAAYTVSGPTLDAAHAFPGSIRDADKFVVTIGGREVPVFLPHDGKFTPPVQHTAEDVAKALASLPAPSLGQVKQVNIDPIANPEDAFWARTYGMANFSSYMTCGSEGRIDIYPAQDPRDVKYLADTLVHETGHAWSNKAWGDDPQGPAWAPWREAVRQDGLLPSTYAGSSPAEDVAESTALYLAMKGTPLADEYRKLYPKRFELLDRQFGGQS